MVVTAKGLDLRRHFRNLLEGAASFMPHESTPEEAAAYRIAHEPIAVTEHRNHQIQMAQRLKALKVEFDARSKAIMERLIKGEIDTRTAQALLTIEIHHNLLTGAAIGVGGIGRMTKEDIARVDAQLKVEVGYLSRWMAQVDRQPDKEWSAAYMANRASMYGGSAATMASESLDKNQMREFPDLPWHPRDGTTLCRRGCCCGWVWEQVDREKGSALVFWRLDVNGTPKEHCETCLLRAGAFKPLIIKDFKFVNMPADLSMYEAD